MMRVSFFISLVCLFTISNLTAKEKPFVLGTASMFADIASVIGDSLIETGMIVPVGGDPHIYEPTPGDARLVVQADLILENGLTFEGWISELISNSGTKAEVILLTEGIDPITSSAHANATDPHAWMDPVNGIVYAQNITKALVKLLPEHANEIQKRGNDYITKLKELDAYIENRINLIEKSKRVIITSHDAFQYFGRRYGMQMESVLGTSTDADVRTSDLVRLNNVIRETIVPVVFIESTINPKIINQIASDNSVSIGGKLYSDSLGDKNSPASTYLKMIRHNADTIVDGLSSKNVDKPQASTSILLRLLPWFLGTVLILGTWFIIQKRSAQ